MNEILEVIKARRSIRTFQKKSIGKEDLDLIIEAALFAPSAKNQQSWQFTVVQNKEQIHRLEQAIGNELSRENYTFLGADTIIIVTNEKDNSNAIADCACALENIFLAAHSLGIGSVWINQLKTICDVPAIRTILSDLGIPDNHFAGGIAALGYTEGIAPMPRPRKGKVKFIL